MPVSNRKRTGRVAVDRDRVDRVVAGARDGLRAIRSAPAHARADWLSAAADIVARGRESFAATIVAEGIKTIREARGEVDRAVRTLRLSAEEAGRIPGETMDFSADPRGTGRWGWIERRPMGVVVAIAPFNDPLNLVAHKVGPALAAGNAVIVKPHPRTPGPARMLRDALLEAGAPREAVTVFEGGVEETGYLAGHPGTDMVSLTGGRDAGRAVSRAAAGKPVALELGGVAVTILHRDADLDLAIPRVVSGMFSAAGQNCVHVQRLLVDRTLVDDVLDRIGPATRAVRTGDPGEESTDMGPVADDGAVQRCRLFVEDALEKGASLVAGGGARGLHVEPTLLLAPGPDARIVREEVFGPVSSIEPVGDLEEALLKARLSGPAIAAAVFTRSLDVPRRLRSLPVGQIVVNDSTDFRLDALPFGGPGTAGLGREGVREAVIAMSQPQVVCVA